ncbi:hypothetical protein Tco_0932300 [Tanacetum coccineum]
MEANINPMKPTQVNKITSSCEIYSSPHGTQYCMENPKQAFVEYASSRIDEARGKWYTFKPEQNNFGDTYNPSWKSHPNLRWRQPQNSQNNFSNSPNRFQPNGLVSNFMASQDARLLKFEADFKQRQSEMTNKINIVLKAIANRMVGALPSDTQDDDSHIEEPEVGENAGIGESEVEYFYIFPTKSELAYRNFTYVTDFMIVEDISSIIDPRLSQVVL